MLFTTGESRGHLSEITQRNIRDSRDSTSMPRSWERPRSEQERDLAPNGAAQRHELASALLERLEASLLLEP
eukprot:9472687-Pyramimonas_sp.AAC.1